MGTGLPPGGIGGTGAGPVALAGWLMGTCLK